MGARHSIAVMGHVFTFHSVELEALPGRGLYWPGAKALLIADPHFGKAAAFRAAGVGVPETVNADLERLSSLLQKTKARELIVLGDFLHAASGRSPVVLDAIRAWCQTHRAVKITLIRGNHDLRAADPPGEFPIEVVDGPVQRDALWLGHRSEELAGRAGIVGHIHPAITLRDVGMQMVRLPCFHVTDDCITLPAFGSFTGCHTLRLQPGQIAIVEADGQMMAIGR